jgi:hypothetical protein
MTQLGPDPFATPAKQGNGNVLATPAPPNSISTLVSASKRTAATLGLVHHVEETPSRNPINAMSLHVQWGSSPGAPMAGDTLRNTPSARERNLPVDPSLGT